FFGRLAYFIAEQDVFSKKPVFVIFAYHNSPGWPLNYFIENTGINDVVTEANIVIGSNFQFRFFPFRVVNRSDFIVNFNEMLFPNHNIYFVYITLLNISASPI